MAKTKVETVLGPIEPSALQKTLTHEHVSINFESCYVPPDQAWGPAKTRNDNVPSSFTLENLNWIRHNPYSCLANLHLDQHTDDVTQDLKLFKQAGGSTIVDNTSMGLQRDVGKMKAMSQATGVNIVCGTGYYIDAHQSNEVKAYTVEQMTQNIVSDINNGIDGTSIKPGIIGEVGCSWPLTDMERRSLQASAIAQTQTRSPVAIHPGRHRTAPEEIMRIFLEAGGEAQHTIMAHLDRTFLETRDLLDFAHYGTYLEYDLFGIEVSYYSFAPELDMQSDAQRIGKIQSLLAEGYGDRVVVAHDIHTPHRLTKLGGHGFAHILDYVVPKMLLKGISEEAVDKILIENPKSWLTCC